jgi:hypothetical protein
MDNVSEETTVKARRRHARTIIGVFVGAVASGAFATAHAQQQALQRGQTPGPRFMVPTFRSAERGIGLQAAEAIRERMGQDFQLKTLWIVPKSDIMTTLVNSGYSTTEALSSNDARALAQLLRAEEYVEGNVETTASGYRVTANMMLIRPDGMVQPLPPVDVAKVSDAAKDYLGEVGWDPVYGARPLKRAIQQHLENPLAHKLLGGEFAPGETIRVTRAPGGNGLAFERAVLN